jgi:hypothetical protein
MSVLLYQNGKIGWTSEGGLAVRLTNKTGSASVKGDIVRASTGTNEAFSQAPADSDEPIGIVYESGIADGSECLIVISGRAQVLLKNSTAATRGNWVKVSDAAGRADATNAAPPGGTVAALEEHMREVGHALESITAGTDNLCYIMIHWN